jgi:hypothetical protein
MSEELPPIPREIWCRNTEPQFCRWGDGWAVLGPESVVPAHNEIAVWRHSEGCFVTVVTGAHVAARVVRHRTNTYTRVTQGPATRYVIAEIRERLEWRGDTPQSAERDDDPVQDLTDEQRAVARKLMEGWRPQGWRPHRVDEPS